MKPKALCAGMVTIDLQYLIDTYPPQNMKVNAERFALATGGPAANAAVTFAHLGGRSHLCAAIGNHPFTAFMVQDFAAWGVEIWDLTPESTGLPPFASILTSKDNGLRTVAAYAAAAPIAAVAELPIIPVENFDILLLDSYQLPAACKLAAQARAAGITVVLDGGSWKPDLESLLEFVDIAICSADFHVPGDENGNTPEAVFAYLSSRGIGQAAITRGHLSILYHDKQQTGEIPTVPVKVVDTLGAGDIFHGAFCYTFALQRDFIAALSQAAAVAARSCESFGTRSWMNQS